MRYAMWLHNGPRRKCPQRGVEITKKTLVEPARRANSSDAVYGFIASSMSQTKSDN